MQNRNVPKFGQKERRFCSPVMVCSWLLLLMWGAFLLYCWKNGLVDQKKINELASEVDHVLIRTETNLRHRVGVDAANNLHNVEVAVPHEDTVSAPPPMDGEIHVVFSTDCSEYQDWQTLLLFHSATVVGQKGKITRIASGCDDTKKKSLDELYKKLYPNYGAHYTPDFKKDAKTKKKCECFLLSLVKPLVIFIIPITYTFYFHPYSQMTSTTNHGV